MSNNTREALEDSLESLGAAISRAVKFRDEQAAEIDRYRALVVRCRTIISFIETEHHITRQDNRVKASVEAILTDVDGQAAEQWMEAKLAEAREQPVRATKSGLFSAPRYRVR